MVTFEVLDGRLRVAGTLDDDAERGLKDACAQLLASGPETVTLDLTGVDRITSLSIGILVALCMDLRNANRRAVLKPSTSLKRVLDMTGLTETFVRAARPVDGKAQERTRSRKAQF